MFVICRSARRLRCVGLWLAVLFVVTNRSSPAVAYTPESPEVQALLRKAVSYLEEAPLGVNGDGGYCLGAMAIVKSGGAENHPLVQKAVEKALKIVDEVAKNGIGGTCYNEAICCYFLSDLNAKQYRSEIGILVNAMLKRQRPNGAWGYFPHTYNDTSQTQYGVLCLWAAHHNDIPVPVEAVERVTNFLLRVQDPGGGWSYQAQDNGQFGRIKQGDITLSMSAAGLSSLYISASLLGFTASNQEAKEEGDGLPPALERVETEEDKKKKAHFMRPTRTSRQMVESAAMLGEAWFNKNFTYETDEWTHYYMYALERYKAFQELTSGKAVAEPAWYNEGVEYLKRTQAADGSWKTKRSHGSSPFVDTSFAVLFLTRSSQKAIRKAVLDEGILVGGRGLPKNLANAKMVDGKVVTPQMVQDFDDLMSSLKNVDDTPFDATKLPGGLSLEDDIKKRTSQLEKLREMVTDENFDARLAAVKTLGSSHELDNVPALLYALSDPDPRVVREAREGLRLISRKIRGFGPYANASKEELVEIRQKWQEWYLAIRPDGELLE